MKANIFIAGAGGIGQAAGLILCEYKDIMDCRVTLGDISEHALEQSLKFIQEGCSHQADIHIHKMSKDGNDDELNNILSDVDVILDCLPGGIAPKIAKLALDNHCHYANLTEYVAETNQIMEMSKDADTAFVLQTGLAPGFINVLACQLYNQFKGIYDSDKLENMTMKVGAITPHAVAPHYYAFTWSPIGVATEYLKDAIVVENYETKSIPALSDREICIIDGKTYEDNFTSGGAADLPQAFEGKIKNLAYKTLRWPGHYAWVDGLLEDIPDNDSRIRTLEETMLDRIPSVEDDVVIIHAAVDGKDKNGVLRKIEKSYEVYPSKVGNQTLRAIQSTTAAPLCQMALMMMKKDWKGTVLQSQIDPQQFMNGGYVKKIYG